MLSKNANATLAARYFLKDAEGRLVETTEDLFRRVARALAGAGSKWGMTEDEVTSRAEDYFHLLYNEKFDSPDFLPNSPTLSNAGTDLGQLSACFVLPVPDDMAGIFETLKHQALVHQTGGGTGFSFTNLRPKNDFVKSTGGVASGPLSFMDIYNQATESVKQGGKRRGANMGILRVDHPDILDFISYKEDLSKLTNFNISVAVTDVFMNAVERGGTYEIVNPRTNEVVTILDARDVFDRIVKRAWSTGEPGVVFIDRMNDECPVPWLGKYEATNPCGEQPLIPYESCNLGSINLENYVLECEQPDGTTAYFVDYIRLREDAKRAFLMLNDVVDANKFPIPELARMNNLTRKIGMGVMGYARMLYKLGIAYGSEEALLVAERVMASIDIACKQQSVELAKTRGWAPAYYDPATGADHRQEGVDIWQRMLKKRHAHAEKIGNGYAMYYGTLAVFMAQHGVHNTNMTTVAPTGTLSIIADTSGGCEPVFGLVFLRDQAGLTMYDSDKVFRDALDKAFGDDEDTILRILDGVEKQHGSLRMYLACADSAVLSPENRLRAERLAEVFVVAHDISPEQHVLTQAAFQKYVDSSISKTCNFPEWATVEDVRRVMLLAYETGCKGITVYRNNCRKGQPLSVKGDTKTVIGIDYGKQDAQVAAVVTVENGEVTHIETVKEKLCPKCGQCNPCGDCACPPEDRVTIVQVGKDD